MEIRRRTKPVSNSVVGSATTVPDARLRPEPSDRSLRARASLSRQFRGERRRPAARGPPPHGGHADFPGHRTRKGAAEGPLRPRHNEHQTREEALFELQLATLPATGKLA
jgi:hypothetical protein